MAASPPMPIATAPDPCPEAVDALVRSLAEYLEPAQVALARRAYEVGATAHAGQTRRSGEAKGAIASRSSEKPNRLPCFSRRPMTV